MSELARTSRRKRSSHGYPVQQHARSGAKSFKIIFLVTLLFVPISYGLAEELFEINNFPVIRSEPLDTTIELSGLLDIESHYVDQEPPGLIFGDDKLFVTPRLVLFLDALVAEEWYFFVQSRVDQGFHPLSEESDARFDEYFVRYSPQSAPAISLQVGKFATILGGWIRRHDSWHSSFINMPLPYENVTTISDRGSASADDFLARRDVADIKKKWVPIIWGPAYTSGIATVVDFSPFQLDIEIKNAAPSSRPYDWEKDTLDASHPTLASRLGYTVSPAVGHGFSLSYGPYLQESPSQIAPTFDSRGDYEQLLVGYDLRYEYRHLSFFAEAWYSEFQMPQVGIAQSTAYFLEAVYQLTSRWATGLRWNQQFFGSVRDSAGVLRQWDDNAERVDASFVFDVHRSAKIKFQYSFFNQQGRIGQGENYAGIQGTLKF